MELNFTKMHGLGNDFVVIDAVRQRVNLSTEQIRHLADRRYGVGADQILLAETSQKPGADFRYRIFNADGGEVEQCGNGVRCLGRFLREQGLSEKSELVVETLAGDTRIQLREDGQVAVNMGPPVLSPADIPFEAEARASHYPLAVGGETHQIGAASMGNPHAVLRVRDLENAPVAHLGALIESHPRFPRRVNVGFMQVKRRDHVRLRVFERGVGETRACGTGACAAAVVGQIQGLLDQRVTVELPGGPLLIEWAGEGEPVWMTGPAVTVFEGRITLP
ncbi:diaminopimelate epimerase [Alkalilimnicola sp. S0819]|uniref:diaminopimelate epimerase n=1 Tax=Alkalilimnicola sp. S0819 TaxID=2613922 RepID=UPI00126224FB|nr:diaminopimelate epimerase [Alkalilimnicola sp. S0819]KAB7622708.1 diaminopimelate epimerase [Alkalilimnicola sp. S0819]MPQ17348.1 diaminopimelate epimerase [Alkalilimnicola sp. S0819]